MHRFPVAGSRPAFGRIAVALFAVTAALLIHAGPLGADAQQPSRQLSAAGSEQKLWLAIGHWDAEEKTQLQSLAYMDKASERIVQASRVPPQIGRIALCAAAGENLYVFFSSESPQAAGTHMRYTKAGEVRETRLPGHVLPMAITGSMPENRPILFAVVDARTARVVADQWEQTRRRRETAPANDEDGGIEPAPDAGDDPAAEKAYAIVQYDAGFWQPGLPGPEACTGAHRVWLSRFAGNHHLFWQRDAESSEIMHAWHDGAGWQPGNPIRLGDSPHGLLATELNRQLVVAALVTNADDPATWHCESTVWQPPSSAVELGRWHAPVLFRNEDGGHLSVPGGAALGSLSDSIVLLWMSEEQPRVGFWSPAGGKPTRPSQPVRLHLTSLQDGAARGVRDFATTLIVVALLLLVFWRRHESIALPIALPDGIWIARSSKRMLAALLDAAPALAIALFIWFDPVMPYLKATWSAARAGRSDDLELLETPIELAFAWWTFRLIYMIYCWVLEATRGATPGKQLLGCRVVTESLQKPSFMQIGIRNVSRLLELEPLLQIWPFILVVFFTRNRQRIGDLLARTVVIDGPGTLPPKTDEAQGDSGEEAGDEDVESDSDRPVDDERADQ